MGKFPTCDKTVCMCVPENVPVTVPEGGARKVCPIISGHVLEGLVVTPPKCDFSQ